MNTKEIIIICLTLIVIALIIGGAIIMSNSNNNENIENPANNNVSNNVIADRLSSDSVSSDDSNIVSEEVKFNAQAGDGYYREVTYKDGGFRQYDTETGELIGSSYQSDQKYLPDMR